MLRLGSRLRGSDGRGAGATDGGRERRTGGGSDDDEGRFPYPALETSSTCARASRTLDSTSSGGRSSVPSQLKVNMP